MSAVVNVLRRTYATIPDDTRLAQRYGQPTVHLTREALDPVLTHGQSRRMLCGAVLAARTFTQVHALGVDDDWCKRCARHVTAD